MSVSAGDVIRVAATQVGPDLQEIVNVFFYEAETTFVTAPDEEVMGALAARMNELYLAFSVWIHESQTADEIQFYNITQARPMGALPWPTYAGGTGVGDYFPPGIAALITASTAVARVMPKKFLGVCMEPHAAGGFWSTAQMIAMAAFATGWLQDAVAIGFGDLVPGTWRRAILTFVPLVAATAKGVCSYQRRRKPGVGS